MIIKRWVNFYPPCDDTTGTHPWRTTSWNTREDADRHARPGRIACSWVSFHEGDGLSEGWSPPINHAAVASILVRAHAALRTVIDTDTEGSLNAPALDAACDAVEVIETFARERGIKLEGK